MNEPKTISPDRLPLQAERKFIVTSPFGWGKAATLAEAKRICRRESPSGQIRKIIYKAMLVHESVTINDFNINHPAELPPIDLGEV